jgi:hypothetical protein
LNYERAGQTLANAATISLGTDGSFTALARVASTHLVVDVNGYYAPHAKVVTLNGVSGASGAGMAGVPAGCRAGGRNERRLQRAVRDGQHHLERDRLPHP